MPSRASIAASAWRSQPPQRFAPLRPRGEPILGGVDQANPAAELVLDLVLVQLWLGERGLDPFVELLARRFEAVLGDRYASRGAGRAGCRFSELPARTAWPAELGNVALEIRLIRHGSLSSSDQIGIAPRSSG